MTKYVIIIGSIYCLALVALSILAKSKEKTSDSFLMAGSNLGTILGFFTFSATLFSAFTILGMPDFFRIHGVGAWIFLAVSDAIMVFLVIWLGTQFRKKASEYKYYGMSGLIQRSYNSSFAGFVAFFGAFVFLIPYVAIQIRGVSLFFTAAFPAVLPMWVWAIGMVFSILLYSEIGGLKAIIYSDVLQGIILLIVIWVVGAKCLEFTDGLSNLFLRIEKTNTALLSVPGPQGIFDFQFLLGSVVAISLIPFTQPQVSTRIIIMKSHKSLFRMATGIGFFAIAIIFPAMLIGMYGALNTNKESSFDFLQRVLIFEQTPFISAIIMVGLLAAAISTSDSQLFSLAGEIRSLLNYREKKALIIARFCIMIFALIALLFALLSGDELVLLARISFMGTALMAPMIFIAIFTNHGEKMSWLPIATLCCILIFVISQFDIFPKSLLTINIEIILLVSLGGAAFFNNTILKR